MMTHQLQSVLLLLLVGTYVAGVMALYRNRKPLRDGIIQSYNFSFWFADWFTDLFIAFWPLCYSVYIISLPLTRGK